MPRRRLAASALLISLELSSPAQAEDKRVIFANVMNRDGTPVHGLTAVNFRADFRGKPAEVLSAAWDDSPRRVALIVDLSGSMKDRGVLALAWEAAEELVSSLTPEHRVALFTIGDALRQHSMLTGDRRMLQQAIQEAKALPPKGGSPLYDAVVAATRAFKGGAFGDAVCLVSDGEDSTSRGTRAEAEAEAAIVRAGARLFWISLTPPFEGGSLSASMALQWADLSKATGGVVFYPRRHKKDHERNELRSLYVAITQGYRLEIKLPEPVDKRRNWDLEVVGPKGRKAKETVLTYQREFVPSLDDK